MSWWYFDDNKVRAYNDDAMRKRAVNQPIDNQLGYAWSDLYNLRGSIDPDDENRELAAAEHYMYARWQVCSGKTNETVMRILTLGYDPVKVLGDLPLFYVIRRVAGHSWSRPSTDSLRWGFRGCNDGAVDARRITPDPDAKAFA